MLSAKSISDVKPTAQRMPPTNKIMRNLTSSTVLLPGSVLMQQRNEGNQGKCHWNLSKFKAKGVEWFHFRKSASFLWHIHGKVFPLSALRSRSFMFICLFGRRFIRPFDSQIYFPTPIVSILCSFFFLYQAWPSILHSYHTVTLKLWCSQAQMRSK